jgi:hypothetical protein
LIPPADPNAKPSGRTVTIERIAMTGGNVFARDAVTTTEWKLESIAVDGTGLSTRGGPPGRLTVRAKLNGTPIAFDVGAVDLVKGAGLARVTMDGFDVTQVRAVVPASLGITPAAGRAFAALDIKAEKADSTLKLVIGGDARVEGLAIRKTSDAMPDAIVSVGKVVVSIKDAQPLARIIALDSLSVDGVDVKVTRALDGRIDLLELVNRSSGAGDVVPPASPAAARAASPAVAAPAETAPGDALRVSLRELTVRGMKVTLRDDTVGTTLAVSDITANAKDVAWPGGGTIPFEVAMGLPSAGKLQVKGAATLAPITVDFTMSMRGAPVDPYQPYIPIPGRISGVFNGESRSRVEIKDGKLARAVSQGRSWIDNLELRDPKGTPGPVKVAKVEIAGVDFTYPGKAAAKTITITKPNIQVERDENGNINIRKLLAADTPPITTTRSSAPVAAKPAAAPAPPAASASSEFTSPIPVELGAFIIEDGYARFIDRTTKPAFSEELSKLAVRIDGLSSTPGKRAKLAVQAILGGDSALDLKGEVAPFGELYADIFGELRNFGLSTVNPYADNAIGWGIDRGKLAVKLHYTIEKNQITAQNEINVENLHVAQSKTDDQVQKRIGLPLGMIVALITDSDNSIKVNLPVKGSLDSWSADFSDAIWTVVKNAVVNIVSAPFKAIGRLFTGGGDKIESVAIDPAKFAVGSATVAADAESHLTKVADFMRRSPGIKLTLAPITTTADAESLRAQALTARLQRVQREAKLDDLAAAVATEFKRVFPGEPLPKTTEEQLARLREQEPVPSEAVGQLATQRLEVIRETLTTKEGIQPARLVAGDATAATAGDGRVEFKIGQ